MEKSKFAEEQGSRGARAIISPAPPHPRTLSPQLQWIVLGAILLIAAFFRFYGIAWDSGYLFHPDERKIVLVASGLSWPASILELFSSESPLNPKFFAYGSFPIYLLRILSVFAPASAYNVPWREDYFVALGLLGRVLSALFDLGTIAMIFFLGRRLYSATVALIASACIAVTVLHIQLSHFYAVDTLLTLLVVVTVFFAARYAAMAKRRDMLLMSIGFGLALATKITAAPLIVPVVLAVLREKAKRDADEPNGEWRLQPVTYSATTKPANPTGGLRTASTPRITPTYLLILPRELWDSARYWLAQIWSARRTLGKIIGIAFLAFVITQPYMLLDPIRYFGQVGTEALVARGWLDFPYTRQYAGTAPFVYHIVQSAVWGMGLPLGIFAWGGAVLFIWRWWRQRDWNSALVLSWALVYFLTVGAQHAKYLRYLLPMLPFLYLMASASAYYVFRNYVLRNTQYAIRFPFYALLSLVALASLLYSFAFVSSYSREHPWLQISDWIYQNVPAHSTIVTEQWDDLLPLPARVNGELRTPSDYNIQQLPMYDPDDAAKMQMIAETIAKSDYVLLASQRLYATIPRLAARYPASARYYQLLFSGQLGFELVAFARNDVALGGVTIAEDTLSDPRLPIPSFLAANKPIGAVWNWGRADESFTVYDHPMPLLFKKTRALSTADILALPNAP